MGFFSKKPIRLGFEPAIIKVGRYSRAEYEPIVGEYVSLWNKPDTNEINFYAKGSEGGQGLLGWITSLEISNHLKKSGLYNATITSCSSSHFQVQVQLKDEYKTPEDYRREQRDKWEGQLKKPYKPRSDWKVRFKMKDSFQKTAKVVLKHHSLEEVINDIDSINQAIWIEDSEGNVLSESNYTLTNDVIKTLRACYSGLLVQIKSIKKASNFYDFEIGI